MANSPRLALRRPQGSDNFTPAADLTDHADKLDAAAIDQSGTLAARPAANSLVAGTYYFATDAEIVYRSDGSSWKVVGVRPVGDIDTAELADDSVTSAKLADAARLGLSESGIVRRGESIIDTAEARTNTAYGTLTTPDQVSGIVLPTNGLIFIAYEALWKTSIPNGVGRAAIFLNANQIKVQKAGLAAPVTQAAAQASNSYEDTYSGLTSCGIGLRGGRAVASDATHVTTGQVLGGVEAPYESMEINGSVVENTAYYSGGICVLFAAAGTYDVSVRFKASSGSVTAKERKLWVWSQAS